MRVIEVICLVGCLLARVAAESYFVTLKENETFDDFYASDLKYAEELRVRDKIKETFSIGKFKGFVGDFTQAALERLKSCPYISEVSRDIEVHSLEVVEQDDAPRHLGRISQHKKLKKDWSFTYDSENSGRRVNAYVIDSGINIGHPEFEGRASQGHDFTGQGSGDSNGHGTHVAGIIGSNTYGVAKGVNLIEVKALSADGSGSLSTIIAALEYTVNHLEKHGPLGVANLSLGATKNSVLNRAIDAAVESGLVIVVAAGNSRVNACKVSPGSAQKAITVGSIDDKDDSFTTFSNWGECVDILASGQAVTSVDFQSTGKPKVLTGTSMSSPIVAGIAANLLSSGVPPAKIKSTILNMATANKVKRTSLIMKGKTPNLIAYLDVDIAQDSDDDYSSDED